MKFNNNKYISANKKNKFVQIIVIFILIIIGICFWLLIIPYVTSYVQNLSVNEVLASITLFLTIAKIISSVANSIININFQAKRKISIDIDIKTDFATITCTIENCSKKRIIPQNIYMMIEEGILKDNIAEFPYILKHEKGEFDCVFAKFCKKGGVSTFPDYLVPLSYKDKFRQILPLKHLSSETIMFIDPGEEFSEDVVLKLKNGVYRVTVVWTSVKEDCICCTKEFVIM